MTQRYPARVNQWLLNSLKISLALGFLWFAPTAASSQDVPPKSTEQSSPDAHQHGGADDHDHDHESGPQSIGHLIEDETLHPRFAEGARQVWRGGLPVLFASVVLLGLRSRRGKT
jgi:hypothetical protein